jgi:hypothetical protein
MLQASIYSSESPLYLSRYLKTTTTVPGTVVSFYNATLTWTLVDYCSDYDTTSKLESIQY